MLIANNKTIRLTGLVAGGTHEYMGQYIVSYDPEYHWPDGSYDGGLLICTRDRAQAGRFNIAEALETWKSGPTCRCHYLDANGKPERPLTAFTVEIA